MLSAPTQHCRVARSARPGYDKISHSLHIVCSNFTRDSSNREALQIQHWRYMSQPRPSYILQQLLTGRKSIQQCAEGLTKATWLGEGAAPSPVGLSSPACFAGRVLGWPSGVTIILLVVSRTTSGWSSTSGGTCLRCSFWATETETDLLTLTNAPQ